MIEEQGRRVFCHVSVCDHDRSRTMARVAGLRPSFLERKREVNYTDFFPSQKQHTDGKFDVRYRVDVEHCRHEPGWRL